MSSFDSEAFAAAGQSHLLERLINFPVHKRLGYSVISNSWIFPYCSGCGASEEEREEKAAPEPPVLVELSDRAVRSDALSQGSSLVG